MTARAAPADPADPAALLAVLPTALAPERLAMSHYCADAARLSELAGLLAGRGLAAVAVTETPAPDDPAPAAVRKLLGGRGLRTSSVNSAGFFGLGKDSTRLLTLAAALDAPLNVIDGGIPPGGGVEPAAQRRARTEAGVRDLAVRARDAGVTLSLEPVHPGGIVGKGIVNTLAQAGRLLEEIDGLACTLDLFHSWWDPDLARFVDAFASRIAVVQVCGLVTSPTGAVERSADPADGAPVLTDLVGRLEEAGYRGLYEIEYFHHDDVTAASERLLGWTGGPHDGP